MIQLQGQTSLANLKKHPHYAKAKSGCLDSAKNVVSDMVKNMSGQVTRSPEIILIPILSKNKLPLAFAELLSQTFGNRIETKVSIINYMKHTNADHLSRLVFKPEFFGTPNHHEKYFLIDDVCTTGSTLICLRNYLLSYQCIVTGGAVLATASFGGVVGIYKLHVKILYAKFGHCLDGFLKTYSIADNATQLTNAQALILLRFANLKDLEIRLQHSILNTQIITNNLI